MWWIVLVLVIAALLWGARWLLNWYIDRLPVCICNRPDCGGGCMEG